MVIDARYGVLGAMLEAEAASVGSSNEATGGPPPQQQQQRQSSSRPADADSGERAFPCHVSSLTGRRNDSSPSRLHA